LCSGPTGYRYFPDIKRLVKDYPSVNLFVKRDAFFSVGGFPIEFWPGEDTKLCLDLFEKFGSGLLYDPNIVVFHHRRELFIPFLKQISRYGQHRGQFARIFPSTSRLLGYFVPSVFFLGLLLGPIVITLIKPLSIVYFSFITLYLFFLLIEALRVMALERNFYSGVLFVIGAFETHFIYGMNFVYGFFRRPNLKLRSVDPVSGKYIGG
jgi:cellulose synthase/poly-beta-1,6-N-acetylglucosamine synthase-like glycosyltransferase